MVNEPFVREKMDAIRRYLADPYQGAGSPLDTEPIAILHLAGGQRSSA
jgi:hypothetical protein